MPSFFGICSTAKTRRTPGKIQNFAGLAAWRLKMPDQRRAKHDVFGTTRFNEMTKRFNETTTQRSFGTKRFNEMTTQRGFRTKRFNAGAKRSDFGTKRFNGTTTQRSFGTTRFNAGTKCFNEMTTQRDFGTKPVAEMPSASETVSACSENGQLKNHFAPLRDNLV